VWTFDEATVTWDLAFKIKNLAVAEMPRDASCPALSEVIIISYVGFWLKNAYN